MNSNLKTSIFNPEDKLSERIETETLYVQFVEKDSAKELGARWDPATKSWVCDIQNKSLMDKYRKRYIEVEYKDKDYAKENGCKWDQECKKWYTYNSNTAY